MADNTNNPNAKSNPTAASDREPMISDNKKHHEGGGTLPAGTQERAQKPMADKTSTNNNLNRQFNNPDDPTERDPTRSSDKPISGKIQR